MRAYKLEAGSVNMQLDSTRDYSSWALYSIHTVNIQYVGMLLMFCRQHVANI
jgi:hypothetical protein